MKLSTWVGGACLAFACYMSYEGLQRGDPSLALLTAAGCILLLWVRLFLFRKQSEAIDRIFEPTAERPVPQPPRTVRTVNGDPYVLPAQTVQIDRLLPPPRRAAHVAKLIGELERAADPVRYGMVRIEMAEGRYLDVQPRRGDAGLVTIKITAYNFTSGQFNARVLNRLKRISGAEWKGPFGVGKSDRPLIELTGTTSSVISPKVLAAIARMW